MALESHSDGNSIVSIRGGISVETGKVLDDSWLLDVDLENLKFNAKQIEN